MHSMAVVLGPNYSIKYLLGYTSLFKDQRKVLGCYSERMVSSLGFPKFSEDILTQRVLITQLLTFLKNCIGFVLALHSFYGWLLTNIVTKDGKESKCPSIGDSWINNGIVYHTAIKRNEQDLCMLLQTHTKNISSSRQSRYKRGCVVCHTERENMKKNTY